MSKMDTDYERFKKEALILKRLRHPGIPIVYDLEEEAFQSYLIEEFLEGDSFYDLIREKGHLNQDTVIRYGIQICDLVQYLHSAEQIPILYLDLQPKNLLVCHEQVKLLDFDHADFLDGANREPVRFGTPGYAAPEQSGDMELWCLYGCVSDRGAAFLAFDGRNHGTRRHTESTGGTGTDFKNLYQGKQGKALWVCVFDPGRSKAAGYPDKWAPDRGGNLSYMCVCRNKARDGSDSSGTGILWLVTVQRVRGSL